MLLGFQRNHKIFRCNLQPPADLGEGGGGGGADAYSSGIRPPADPKGPAFALFWDIQFWLTDPKKFLRAPSKFSNFYGGARTEKTLFFCKANFQKVT